MMNRAVLRVTSEQIATALRIREGVRIVAAASDPLTCDIDLILEGHPSPLSGKVPCPRLFYPTRLSLNERLCL